MANEFGNQRMSLGSANDPEISGRRYKIWESANDPEISGRRYRVGDALHTSMIGIV